MTASPIIDPGTAATGTWSGGATKNFTISTTDTNDIIVVVVGYELASAQRSVLSVVGGTLGSFALRSIEQANGATGSSNNGVETWWVKSTGALTGETITITMDSAIDDACYIAFGVNGLHSLTSPFDSHSGLPVGGQELKNISGGAAPTLTYSTAQADDFVLFTVSANGLSGSAYPAGYTPIAQVNNGGGSLSCALAVSYLSVSSTQSGTTVQSSSTNDTYYVSTVDAFTADATSSTETGTGVLAFSGISMEGSGFDLPVGAAVLSFSGMSIVSAASRVETSTAALAFSGISVSGIGDPGVSISGALAFDGVNIFASGVDASLVGARQFWTF